MTSTIHRAAATNHVSGVAGAIVIAIVPPPPSSQMRSRPPSRMTPPASRQRSFASWMPMLNRMTDDRTTAIATIGRSNLTDASRRLDGSHRLLAGRPGVYQVAESCGSPLAPSLVPGEFTVLQRMLTTRSTRTYTLPREVTNACICNVCGVSAGGQRVDGLGAELLGWNQGGSELREHQCRR